MAPSGVETHQVRVVTTPVKAFCTLINIWENKNVIVMHFFSFVETSLVPVDERKIVIFFLLTSTSQVTVFKHVWMELRPPGT